MSVYFQENLRANEDISEGQAPLTQDIEAALEYAFRKVLEQDIPDADRDELIEEVRAEGILVGVGTDRVKDIYLKL